MRRVRCYIASPYSNGDKETLVQKHMNAAYELLKLGFNPYAPLYNHYIQTKHPDLDHDGFPWLDVDKEWLLECDMMIRLHFKNHEDEEIKSPGANEEERYANSLGIPVFHFDTVEEMARALTTFENTTK